MVYNSGIRRMNIYGGINPVVKLRAVISVKLKHIYKFFEMKGLQYYMVGNSICM